MTSWERKCASIIHLKSDFRSKTLNIEKFKMVTKTRIHATVYMNSFIRLHWPHKHETMHNMRIWCQDIHNINRFRHKSWPPKLAANTVYVLWELRKWPIWLNVIPHRRKKVIFCNRSKHLWEIKSPDMDVDSLNKMTECIFKTLAFLFYFGEDFFATAN